MKRKLAAAAAIVLLLGVGYVGYFWYRHVTRENPYESPARDAPKAPKWTSPDGKPGTPEADPPENENGFPEQDPPNDSRFPRKFVVPPDYDPSSPKQTFGMPLDVEVEVPEVPPEIMGPLPPIEGEAEDGE